MIILILYTMYRAITMEMVIMMVMATVTVTANTFHTSTLTVSQRISFLITGSIWNWRPELSVHVDIGIDWRDLMMVMTWFQDGDCIDLIYMITGTIWIWWLEL